MIRLDERHSHIDHTPTISYYVEIFSSEINAGNLTLISGFLIFK